MCDRQDSRLTGYDFQNLKVLICDDSRQMRSLLKTFLSGFGIKNVAEANDAKQAFVEMTQFDPELVITDWNMPPTSGLDFIPRVRMGEDSPNIMLTGYTEMHRVKQARDAGVSAFLAKPLSAQSLYKRLISIVDDNRPFIRNGKYFGPDRRTARSTGFMGGERRTRSA